MIDKKKVSKIFKDLNSNKENKNHKHLIGNKINNYVKESENVTIVQGIPGIIVLLLVISILALPFFIKN